MARQQHSAGQHQGRPRAHNRLRRLPYRYLGTCPVFRGLLFLFPPHTAAAPIATALFAYSMDKATVAVVQAGTVLFDNARTLDKVRAYCDEAAHLGASLVVFPEA